VPLVVERGAARARETHGRSDASGPCRRGRKCHRQDAAGEDDPRGSSLRVCPPPVRCSPLLCIVALACASAPPPAPPAPPPIVAPPTDLPRSSIAAILAHRV